MLPSPLAPLHLGKILADAAALGGVQQFRKAPEKDEFRVHPEHTNQDLSETPSPHLLGIIHGHDDAADNEGEIANIHNLLTVSQASISQVCFIFIESCQQCKEVSTITISIFNSSN